jgi:hypothetical protein
MTTYQQKITFGETRESEVRDVLIYCRDHHCSHHVDIHQIAKPAAVKAVESNTDCAISLNHSQYDMRTIPKWPIATGTYQPRISQYHTISRVAAPWPVSLCPFLALLKLRSGSD